MGLVDNYLRRVAADIKSLREQTRQLKLWTAEETKGTFEEAIAEINATTEAALKRCTDKVATVAYEKGAKARKALRQKSRGATQKMGLSPFLPPRKYSGWTHRAELKILHRPGRSGHRADHVQLCPRTRTGSTAIFTHSSTAGIDPLHGLAAPAESLAQPGLGRNVVCARQHPGVGTDLNWRNDGVIPCGQVSTHTLGVGVGVCTWGWCCGLHLVQAPSFNHRVQCPGFRVQFSTMPIDHQVQAHSWYKPMEGDLMSYHSPCPPVLAPIPSHIPLPPTHGCVFADPRIDALFAHVDTSWWDRVDPSLRRIMYWLSPHERARRTLAQTVLHPCPGPSRNPQTRLGLIKPRTPIRRDTDWYRDHHNAKTKALAKARAEASRARKRRVGPGVVVHQDGFRVQDHFLSKDGSWRSPHRIVDTTSFADALIQS